MKKYAVQGLIGLLVMLAGVAAFAEETTQDDARLVARGWSMLNGSTFGSLGSVNDVLVEKDDQGQVLWYVVVMTGGAAVVAPDTEIEPVLAVLPGSDGIIPKGSTLDVMLRRDLANRLLAVRRPPLKVAALAAPAPVQSKSSGKWDKLRRISTMKFAPGGGSPATIVRWLDGWNSANTRNGVQTLRFWNQDSSPSYFSNNQIFNKYTPHNYYCGCVATAGAAIMHYFRAPSGAVVTRSCMDESSVVSLTTKGGVYKWSLIDGLDLTYGDPVTLSEQAVDLLARVAYDCGVGCEMMYGKEASGSYTGKLQASFRDVFGATHAQLVTKSGGMYGGGEKADIGPENYAKVIYNQIRGGAPIALGIDGHEVVACGYGFDVDETDYTYVFLGWGGSNDAWYALPTIDTKATAGGGWYTSTFIDELITEISFDDKFVAVCGQLVDIDGNPIADGELKMGNGEVVKTDAKGYWGTRVDPNDPNAWVEDAIGVKHYFEIGALAKSTTDGGVAAAALAEALPEPMLVELLDPSIDVYDGDSLVKQHGTLDSAIETARGCSQPRLVLTDSAKLQAAATIDFSVTIVATNADPSATSVAFRQGTALTVAAGATLTLTNVAFTGATVPYVTVETGGRLRLQAGVTLDRGELAAVETAAADGFVLDGPLTKSLTLRCQAATALGDAFGVYTCPDETATAMAALLVDADDPDRERRGIAAGGQLTWGSPDIPLSDAVGYFVEADGTTNVSARLDRVFERFETELAGGKIGEHPTLTLLAGGKLTRSLAVQGELTICGGGSAPQIDVVGNEDNPQFTVPLASSLTVSNLTFKGYRGNALFKLNGEKLAGGGELILEKGTVIDGAVGTYNTRSGAIAVSYGTVTMRKGAAIRNCRAEGVEAKGGGIWLAGTSCVLNLEGGSIRGCHASTYGGGVYVGANAVLNLSGAATVKGNTSGNGLADDIYIASSTARVNLTGALTGGEKSVGIRNGMTEDVVGASFLSCAAGVTPDERSLRALFSDKDDTLTAGLAEGGGSLVWVVDTRPAGQIDDLSGAADLVIYGEGGAQAVTNGFDSFAHALAALTNDATIVMMTPGGETFSEDLVFADRTLTVRAGVPNGGLKRAADCRLVLDAGAALTLRDIVVNGGLTAGARTLIRVNEGASLTLASGACVCDVRGSLNRASGGITVSKGTIRMQQGAVIRNCVNVFPAYETEAVSPADYSVGGGLLVDNGTAYLEGGEVTACSAFRAGGVYIGNKSTAYISGDVRITGNVPYSGRASNLAVEDDSTLLVTDPFVLGSVGVSDGIQCDTNVFARVPASALPDGVLSATNYVTTAARFFRDDDSSVVGQVVTNGTEALLVWPWAIKEGVYVDKQGNSFGQILGDTIPLPTPVSLRYTGNIQTGVVEDVSYTVTGNVGTNAGEYVALVTPAAGFLWADGTAGTKEVVWTIAKGTYDLSGITFEDATYTYDGTEKNIFISGELPAGVRVEYYGNPRVEPSPMYYEVRAKFYGDEKNYEKIPDKVAHLTINWAPVDIPTAVTGLVYTGKPQTGVVESVGFTLTGNVATEVGSYTATATLSTGYCWSNNARIPMSISWSIAENPNPPDPPPGPTPEVWTNSPSHIAFESITRESETSWMVVVTNREKYCWYRLMYTDDLAKGFTSTGDWVQATVDAPKAWTNRFDFSSDAVKPAAYFWRAEGTWGTDEIPPVSPDNRPPAP